MVYIYIVIQGLQWEKIYESQWEGLSHKKEGK